LLILALACSTLAAPHRAAAQQPVDPAFERDIQKLMEITGAQRLGEQMIGLVMQQLTQSLKTASPNAPPRMLEVATEVTRALFTKEFPALLPRMAASYAKVLTPDDVKQLIAFYETPLGRRMVEVMPALQDAGARAGQEWAQQLVPRLQNEIMQRFKQEGLAP
jgi:hypothetical protein